jgi:hypothetical protein
MFVGVGIVGGPVFPVGSSAQVAPPLPVFAASTDAGPAPLPPEAPPTAFAEPVVSSYSALTGHDAPATGSNGT